MVFKLLTPHEFIKRHFGANTPDGLSRLSSPPRAGVTDASHHHLHLGHHKDASNNDSGHQQDVSNKDSGHHKDVANDVSDQKSGKQPGTYRKLTRKEDSDSAPTGHSAITSHAGDKRKELLDNKDRHSTQQSTVPGHAEKRATKNNDNSDHKASSEASNQNADKQSGTYRKITRNDVPPSVSTKDAAITKHAGDKRTGTKNEEQRHAPSRTTTQGHGDKRVRKATNLVASVAGTPECDMPSLMQSLGFEFQASHSHHGKVSISYQRNWVLKDTDVNMTFTTDKDDEQKFPKVDFKNQSYALYIMCVDLAKYTDKQLVKLFSEWHAYTCALYSIGEVKKVIIGFNQNQDFRLSSRLKVLTMSALWVNVDSVEGEHSHILNKIINTSGILSSDTGSRVKGMFRKESDGEESDWEESD